MNTAIVTLNARYERHLDRDWLVAPLTMIVPGVLSGSNGSLLYEVDDVEKSVAAWNGIPILLGHRLNAQSPETFDRWGLGMIANARMSNRRLVADGWFDVDRLAAVAPSLLDVLRSGGQVELSTGLHVTPERRAGVFNGREYDAIARLLIPDHLAILPDQVGACSLIDGCGVHVE